MEKIQIYLDQGIGFLTTYGLRLIGALIVLLIGMWIIKGLTRSFGNMMDRKNMDASLRPFLKSMFSVLLKVLLVISILGMIGIQMTSFIAILGAAGLAIGLALSGTLQNFAGGVLILVLKPFKAGDFIDAQGYMGTVREIQIFNTILKTPDNKTVIIPNGGLSTSSVTNFSTEAQRRVEWTFGIAYGDSVETTREILNRLINEDSRILNEPAPFIAVSALADSSVNFVVRAWVNSSDYWGVFFDMNEKVYNTFNKEGINIPFPQMDVHMHQAGV